MSMLIGDGASQPVEGVATLSDLAAVMDESEAPETPEELPEVAEGEEPEVEEPEEEAEEAEEGEEPTFTIKVDGKDIALPKSELIELAQKGTDYTNKTMAVAKERDEVKAERARVTEQRTQYEQTLGETLNRLNAWTQFMESQVGTPPDTAMLDYDTPGFIRAKEQYDARRGQLQQGYAAQQQLLQEQARHRQALIQEKAAATEQVLTNTLPGWNDATLNALAEYAGSHGLTTQSAEMAMLEPGFWQLAHKAKAYDALVAKKAELKPKTELSKVSKPAASNPTPRGVIKQQEARKAFNAKPSLDTLSQLVD